MNSKQKLGYMCIGCLFTIAGYILASLGGDTTHAQQDEQVLDKIVCRHLEVVNKEGEPVGVIVEDEDTGGIVVRVRPAAGVGIDNGVLFVRNTERQEIAVMAATEDGNGVIVVRNAAGEDAVGMGANKDGDGVIQSYKGGWRTH